MTKWRQLQSIAADLAEALNVLQNRKQLLPSGEVILLFERDGGNSSVVDLSSGERRAYRHPIVLNTMQHCSPPV